jgi:DNA-binding MarR family transcriptional regulator
MNQFLKFKTQVGEAIWLLLLLALYAEQSEGQWWPVRREGEFISDARLAVFLGESEATAKKHRRRLEKEGLIRTEPTEMHLHRRFWVREFDTAMQEQALEKLPIPASNLVH